MSNAMKPVSAFLFVLILATSACIFAADTPDLEKQFTLANEAYASGQHVEAISAYRSIIARYGFSPELLHNLGNSYLASNQPGMAILQFLRGLSIAPGDDDLLNSLHLARETTGLFNPELNMVESFFDRLDMNQWFIAALAGFVALSVLVLVYALLPAKKGGPILISVLAAFMLVCLYGAHLQSSKWWANVVIKPGARLLMSPFPTAISRGMLAEGTLVFSEKPHGRYQYVRDEKGRTGWLDARSFAPIPTSHTTYSQDNAGQ